MRSFAGEYDGLWVGACLCCVENTTEGHLCVCKRGDPFSIRIDCYGRFKCKYREVTTEESVVTASGTFGYGLEFADFVNLEDISGIIVKGTTLKPREGNPYPRMAERLLKDVELCGAAKQGRGLFLRAYLSPN